VPYAVELALGDPASAAVRKVWRALSGIGVTWMETSGAEPHISLGIWETIERGPFEAELARFAADVPQIEVTFEAVGMFPGSAIYLRPIANPLLAEVQKQLHVRLATLGHGAWQYYLPGTWVPHCTVAMEFPPDLTPEARALVEQVPLPLTGHLESAALIEFRPVRELARYPLGG
jgi:2'-5' RNA ligase